MRIKFRYLKVDVHEGTAVADTQLHSEKHTSEATPAATATATTVTRKLHAVNASDDDL